MKRIAVIALMLLGIALPVAAAKEKAKPVDMKDINHVFVGWVDINPDDWKMQGYANKQEWLDVISGANESFQKDLAKTLSGLTVTMAKNKDDVNTAGNDLYIKFSDARVDKGYRLHISVHFIDLKTNNEVGSIPLQVLGAHLCGLSGCINKELDKVNEEIGKNLNRPVQKAAEEK